MRSLKEAWPCFAELLTPDPLQLCGIAPRLRVDRSAVTHDVDRFAVTLDKISAGF